MLIVILAKHKNEYPEFGLCHSSGYYVITMNTSWHDIHSAGSMYLEVVNDFICIWP